MRLAHARAARQALAWKERQNAPGLSVAVHSRTAASHKKMSNRVTVYRETTHANGRPFCVWFGSVPTSQESYVYGHMPSREAP